MPYVGGWIRLNHDYQGSPVVARIVGAVPYLANIGPTPVGSANVALVATKLHFDRELTNGIISGIGDGRKTFHIIPPAFEFILSEQTATKAPSKISDADFLGYDAVGACPPNYSETSPWELAMTVVPGLVHFSPQHSVILQYWIAVWYFLIIYIHWCQNSTVHPPNLSKSSILS